MALTETPLQQNGSHRPRRYRSSKNDFAVHDFVKNFGCIRYNAQNLFEISSFHLNEI